MHIYICIYIIMYSRLYVYMCTYKHKNISTRKHWKLFVSLQALCTVAISPTLNSRAYQCRTHSEAHKVLLRQYRRWCAICFGRRTWWQRYGSVSPHLELNILFVETYQITLIWYSHTRPSLALEYWTCYYFWEITSLSRILWPSSILFLGGHSLS